MFIVDTVYNKSISNFILFLACQMHFLHMLGWYVFSNILLTSWITLVDFFLNIKLTCIYATNSTWSCCIKLFICCWIHFTVFIKRIWTYAYFGDWFVICFLCKELSWFCECVIIIKWAWKCSYFYILQEFYGLVLLFFP